MYSKQYNNICSNCCQLNQSTLYTVIIHSIWAAVIFLHAQLCFWWLYIIIYITGQLSIKAAQRLWQNMVGLIFKLKRAKVELIEFSEGMWNQVWNSSQHSPNMR